MEFTADAVVLATGGFQNNAVLVGQHWPAGRAPARILLGSGGQSTGSGLDLAASVVKTAGALPAPSMLQGRASGDC